MLEMRNTVAPVVWGKATPVNGFIYIKEITRYRPLLTLSNLLHKCFPSFSFTFLISLFLEKHVGLACCNSRDWGVGVEYIAKRSSKELVVLLIVVACNFCFVLHNTLRYLLMLWQCHFWIVKCICFRLYVLLGKHIHFSVCFLRVY